MSGEKDNNKSSKNVKRRVIFLILSIMGNLLIPVIIISIFISLVIAIMSAINGMFGGNNGMTKDEFNQLSYFIKNTTIFKGYDQDQPYGAIITGQGELDYTIKDHMRRDNNGAGKSVAMDIHEIGGQHGDEASTKKIIEKIMRGDYANAGKGTVDSGFDLDSSDITQLQEEGANSRVQWLNEMYRKYKSNWDFSYFRNFKNGSGKSSNFCYTDYNGRRICGPFTGRFTDPFYFYSTISGVVHNYNNASGCVSIKGKEYAIGFCHYNRLMVQKGEEVGAGQIIGTMGMRGMTTGTHIHYEIGKIGKMGRDYQFLSNSSNNWVEMIPGDQLKEFFLQGKVVGNIKGMMYFDHIGSNTQCIVNPESCSGSSLESTESDGSKLGDFIDEREKIAAEQGIDKSIFYTVMEIEGVSKDRSGSFDTYEVAADGGVGLFQIQEPASDDGFPSKILKQKYADFSGNVEGTPTVTGPSAHTTVYKGFGCNQGYDIGGDKSTVQKSGEKYLKNSIGDGSKEQAIKLGCDIEKDHRFNIYNNFSFMMKELFDKKARCKSQLITKKMRFAGGPIPNGITEDSPIFRMCMIISYNGLPEVSQKIFFNVHVKNYEDVENGVETSYNTCMRTLPEDFRGNCKYARLFAKNEKLRKEGKLSNSYFIKDTKSGEGTKIKKNELLVNTIKEGINSRIKIVLDKFNETFGEKEYDFNTDSSLTKFVGPNHSFNNIQYNPNLVEAKGPYITSLKEGGNFGRKEAIDSLNKMAEKYQKDNGGKKIVIASSFRDYSHQKRIIDNGCSLALCSRPGFSEHQSGLTFDLWSASSEKEWKSGEFPKRYEWLKENAHNFGFTQSYQNGPNVEGYEIEPWHWRYVGVELAQKLKKEGISFTQFYQAYQEKKKKK